MGEAVAAQDADRVHGATDAWRSWIEDAFAGRRLTSGSLLVERKRRLHERFDALDDAAAGDRWGKAQELYDEVGALAERLAADAHELPPAQASASFGFPVPTVLRNTFTVARKEAVLLLRGTQGLLLLGLLLVTFGIGLESALGEATVVGQAASVELVWQYAHSLDFLALPLAGLLVGYGLINEELRSNTIHVLAAQPVSRAGIVLGKFLGMAAALAIAVGASAGLVGLVAYVATGTLGSPGTVLAYPLACYLLTVAFGAVALLASSVIDRTGPTLAAGFGAYILLGPVWQNVFLTRSLEQVGSPARASEILVYLATPFTAWWNWTSELLGPVNQATGLPQGEPWHAALVQAVATGAREGLPFYATHAFYGFVLFAWIALAVAIAVVVLRHRDLG